MCFKKTFETLNGNCVEYESDGDTYNHQLWLENDKILLSVYPRIKKYKIFI